MIQVAIVLAPLKIPQAIEILEAHIVAVEMVLITDEVTWAHQKDQYGAA